MKMTGDEIFALEGTLLDGAVAEHVMGYTWDDRGFLVKPGSDSGAYDPSRGVYRYVPNWSYDINAAWQVVERFGEAICRVALLAAMGGGSPDDAMPEPRLRVSEGVCPHCGGSGVEQGRG